MLNIFFKFQIVLFTGFFAAGVWSVNFKEQPIEYDRAPSDIQTAMPEVWYEYEPDLFPLQDDQNA